MNIPEIAKLKTAIEMRREVLRLAVARSLTEEDVWIELDIYRKTHPPGQREPVHIGKILKTIIPIIRGFKFTDSPIEDILAYELKNRNVKFEPQKEIGKYRVDFFFPEANLVVEADGKEYHSKPEQREKDEQRQMEIIKKGYSLLRFTGSQIYTDVERCVDNILAFLTDAREEKAK